MSPKVPTTKVPMRIGDASLQMLSMMLRASELPTSQWDDVIKRYVRAQLPALDTPGAICDLTDIMRLGEALTRISPAGDRLGLIMGQQCQDTDLGLAGQIARTAPTLQEALKQFVHYHPLNARCYRGNPSLHLGHAPALRFYSIAPYSRYNRFVVDSTLCSWQQLINQLCGRTDAILAVDIEYDLCDYATEVRSTFALPTQFGQRHNQLLINPHALSWPVLTAQAELHHQLKQLGDQLLHQLAANATLTGRVKHWLGPRLQGQSPTLEAAAEAMGMAAWTLRRRLQDENSSYQHLLDDLRRDLAVAHIRETTLSFGEVAFMLGFSSPGAFQRAFKRWTNDTPGDFRKRYNQARVN